MPQHLADLSKGSSAPQKVRRQRMAQQVCAMILRIQTDSSQGQLHDVAHGIGRTTEAIRYNLARYAARLGQREKAQVWLDEAFRLSNDSKAVKLMALDDQDLEQFWTKIQGV